jgi:copper chaperone
MISFQVNDMTCGHCVNAITQAVQHLDQQATVHINLAAHRVDIEASTTGAIELGRAIQDAGYTPLALRGASPAAPAAKRGCCCG